MLKRKKIDVNKEYTRWCREIAKKDDEFSLISHFRTHTSKHFNRHKGEGKIGLIIWMIAVFNFMNIFKEKYKVGTDDMLFQLCIYLKQHKKGPIPSFDIDKFIEEHQGAVKDYYLQPKRIKKWQSKNNTI